MSDAWGASWGTPSAWAVSWSADQIAASQGQTDTIGSKPRKKIRGPYSDPLSYEAYIARCIAEREKPRVNVETAILKEALVDAVEARRQTEYAERDALLNENALLERLIAVEQIKRNVQALLARQQQIDVLLEQAEEEEAKAIITLLDEM